MNTLQNFIRDHRLNENKVMNLFQDHAIISDLCVVAADVCDGDCLLAVTFLKSAESDMAISAIGNK